jgi:hypothetical protein
MSKYAHSLIKEALRRGGYPSTKNPLHHPLHFDIIPVVRAYRQTFDELSGEGGGAFSPSHSHHQHVQSRASHLLNYEFTMSIKRLLKRP